MSDVYVLAGTNGAGKSSIAGAMLEYAGAEYFNPDRAARQLLLKNPGVTQQTANSAAWHEGRRLLERAVSEHLDFAFETTLGGTTMTTLLERAVSEGCAVRVWYVGLASPELHINRVRSRVAHGGHDIPERTIRERYDRSRLNLIRLLPILAELRVHDNTREADPREGLHPEPELLIHMVDGQIVTLTDLTSMPAWAKPVVATALKMRISPNP